MQSNNKIIDFLQEQLVKADDRTKMYAYYDNGKSRPEREIFVKLADRIDDFIQKKNMALRWSILAGLRGTGKTTVLSQLYRHYSSDVCYKLYLSLDQVTQVLGFSLSEVVNAYEEILGVSFEQLDKPLLLFLDEVQYDEKWGVVLKSIFDRSSKVFILATGSSALLLNANADVARRAIFEKMYPLDFPEYLMIKTGKRRDKETGLALKSALFDSVNASEVYKQIQKIEPRLKKYLYGISKSEVDEYIKFGTLPFTVHLKNDAMINELINRVVERIINEDLTLTGVFGAEILNKIPSILYSLADMDAFSFNKLSEAIGISRQKLVEIFSLLERAEAIIRVYPYGSHLNQVKKASKYLFISPAFRYMYYSVSANIIGDENFRGKLMEDIVGMYLYRFLNNQINTSFTYDSAQGGADFIIGWKREKVIFEIGAGKKGIGQILNTMKKVKAKYGITVSQNKLLLAEDRNIVQIPLDYFLLLDNM